MVLLPEVKRPWREGNHLLRPSDSKVKNECQNEKGKSTITGPMCAEGSLKLRFADFMKTSLDSGKVVRITHRPLLPPGNTPGTHFC